jgi:TPR repeat protein
MVRTQYATLWIGLTLVARLIGPVVTAPPADDTARFSGTWQASFVYNGQMVTMVSVHDGHSFKNYFVGPTGNTLATDGTFSAAAGRYTTHSAASNDAGTYRFLDDNTVICTNAVGLSATWKRIKAPGSPASDAQPAAARPAPAQPTPAAATASDPSLPPATIAAIAAFNKKDYTTAWRDFMEDAERGNSEAQAGVGAMLFAHLNPPGTGYYAQCEKWLLASANQGNVKGMDFLGQYYYATGVATAGGINPGINTAPIPPALQQQAEARFALARQWFERSAAKNDGYAMGYLARMLDAGVGGPADPARAAQLRDRVKHLTDPNFVKLATGDPGKLAMDASWKSGHYADALQKAQNLAAKGDANAEALLGRAYYEGVGVSRSYPTALIWLNKAIAQNNADAMFILGLMYEWGRGVRQDVPKAQGLFDRAAALGQFDARTEAAGMRMEGAAAQQAARAAAQCHSRGGVYDGIECTIDGYPIDPY